MTKRRLICFFSALMLAACCFGSASAVTYTTLRNGSRGDDVKTLQQALIDLGYLNDKADGIFGNKTENAVRSFQIAKNLTVDGLAGKKTQALLYELAGSSTSAADSSSSSSTSAASSSSTSAASSTTSSSTSSAATSSTSSASSSSSSSSSGSGNLFSGNYSTIRINDRGDRVKILQQALIRLNYLSGSADGIFGNKTLSAVIDFQKENNLSADGLAGKKTLKALETADKNGTKKGSASSSSTASSSSSSASSSTSTAEAIQEESAAAKTSTSSSGNSPSSSKTLTAPDGGVLKLLHWFNDIKPSLKSGQTLTVYDPSSGLSWKLRVHSCGRHCDAEPLTAEDTATMVKAFGGVNTWDQKGVYVKLPSGVWTIGSTHDMPHLSGHISDNNFDGHLCVHFLRDMSETETNDPKYGVANQNTIRTLWKNLTGETLTN